MSRVRRRRGETRWSKTYDEDGHRRHETGRMSLKNLDDDEIEDAAERSCADFRESLVRDGLPHQWRHERHADAVGALRSTQVSRGDSSAREEVSAGETSGVGGVDSDERGGARVRYGVRRASRNQARRRRDDGERDGKRNLPMSSSRITRRESRCYTCTRGRRCAGCV